MVFFRIEFEFTGKKSTVRMLVLPTILTVISNRLVDFFVDYL